MEPTHDDRRVTVPLYRAAHGRTGDKGNRSNISVIAWHPALWPLLVEQVTEARVAAQFAHRRPSRGHALPAAEAAGDELRARRRARRRRQRRAQPRQPRQGAVLPAARPATIAVPAGAARAPRRRREPDSFHPTTIGDTHDPLLPPTGAPPSPRCSRPSPRPARSAQAKYPDQADHLRRAVRRRQRDRPARARARRVDHRRHQAGGGRRQQGRRQRHDGGAGGGTRRRPTATRC